MLLPLLVSLFIFIPVISAESGSPSDTGSKQPAIPAAVLTQKANLMLTPRPKLSVTPGQFREQAREQAMEKVCAQTEARIEARLTRYAQNRDQWMNRHQGIISRLTSLADKLEARGCDAAQLRAEIQTYQGLVENFAAAFRDFYTSLQGTRQYACGQSEGQFASQVRESQTKLQAVQAAGNTLQQHVKTTLQTRLQTANQACQEVQ